MPQPDDSTATGGQQGTGGQQPTNGGGQQGTGGQQPANGSGQQQAATGTQQQQAGGQQQGAGQRSGNGQQRTGRGQGLADWFANGALRTGIILVGFTLFLFALGQAVGLELLGMFVDAVTSQTGRWLVVAAFALVLIFVGQQGVKHSSFSD